MGRVRKTLWWLRVEKGTAVSIRHLPESLKIVAGPPTHNAYTPKNPICQAIFTRRPRANIFTKEIGELVMRPPKDEATSVQAWLLTELKDLGLNLAGWRFRPDSELGLISGAFRRRLALEKFGSPREMTT
jgi:hypothetical protein